MKIVLFGAHGMLGRDLVAEAPAGASIAGFDLNVDITDAAAVRATLERERPDWVINSAAYTAVDKAETERDIAMRVNGDALGIIGAAAKAVGARVLHVSTDYVFAGDATRPYVETDAVSPVNAYGESKLAGEQALAASGARHAILRTQWLFGVHGKSFPRTMWERATKQQPTKVVNDQWGRPTFTVDLARATWALVARDAEGIVHVANAGDPVTWYDLAKAVFARAGAEGLLSPCTTTDYPTPARRPRYSALSTAKLESLGTKMPDWRDAVGRFLRALGDESAVAGMPTP